MKEKDLKNITERKILKIIELNLQNYSKRNYNQERKQNSIFQN